MPLKTILAAISKPDAEHAAFRLVFDKETLAIPPRIYQDETELRGRYADHSQILDSLLTRHHDGFVRARALARILSSTPETWTFPFVIELMGEYVVEILQQIEDGFEHLNLEACTHFLTDNPAFLALTRQRVMSYWDCYYRAISRQDYVGFRLIRRLEALAPPPSR
ncbi:hypothetical protein BH10PSE3_BH10PSE3_37490 [soil metagenome]